MKLMRCSLFDGASLVAALGLAMLCVAMPSPLEGAVITWQTATISGAADVSTAGNVVQAANIGGSTTIVNGVSFAGAGISGQTPIVGSGEGSLQLSATVNWGVNASAFGSASGVFSGLDEPYKALLSSAGYTQAQPITTATYTLLNLTFGQQYLVQFWVNDSRSISGVAGREITLTAGNSAVLDFNVSGLEGGLGTFVTGIFTADATTQAISVFAAATNPNNAAPQLNGYQLRAIPEPSALALVSMSVVGVLMLARRPRRLRAC